MYFVTSHHWSYTQLNSESSHRLTCFQRTTVAATLTNCSCVSPDHSRFTHWDILYVASPQKRSGHVLSHFSETVWVGGVYILQLKPYTKWVFYSLVPLLSDTIYINLNTRQQKSWIHELCEIPAVTSQWLLLRGLNCWEVVQLISPSLDCILVL